MSLIISDEKIIDDNQLTENSEDFENLLQEYVEFFLDKEKTDISKPLSLIEDFKKLKGVSSVNSQIFHLVWKFFHSGDYEKLKDFIDNPGISWM